MKERLKCPYSFKERRVMIHEGVLFIPEYCLSLEEFTFEGFPGQRVHVEYCSGNGAWILDRAKKNKDIYFVAVEKRFDRVQKIWARRKKEGIDNLFIVFGEALIATKHYFKDQSIDEIFINFPDPWPKNKHAKNRLIAPPFVEEMARVLKRGGKLTVVTDDATYSQQIILECLPSFTSTLPAPYFTVEKEEYGTSFFEELWRSKGLEIRYHEFLNVK